MAYNSVLERDMSRPKSKGVEGLRDTEDNEDLRSRREQALAMIEESKQKFDPENFQTLTEQDRPGVFRPVAVNMPSQQQTANTAQRMQQMAAQGVRPVGMAKGGFAEDSYMYGYSPYELSQFLAQRGLTRNDHNYDLPSYNEEDIYPTISSETTESDEEYFDRLAKLRKRLKEVRDMPVEAETKKEKKKSSFDMKGTVPPRTDSRGAVLQMTPEEIATMDAGGKGLPVMNPNEAYYSRRDPFTGELLRPPVEKSRGVGPIEAYGTEAEMDRVLRQQAAPDRRDYAGEREYTANVIADQAAREQAAPDKRDFAGERQEMERTRGIASLADMEKGVAAGRDAYGAEAPLAVDQEARGIVGQMGRAGELRSAAGIRSGEEKAAAPVTAQAAASAPTAAAAAAPAATSAAPSAGGVGSLKAEGESSDLGPMTIESIRSQRAREREENVNLALIQAGLSMMAGRSSNALTNIGEGARAGIGQFASQESESKKAMRESMRDYMDQKRLAQQDKLARDEMALRERLAGAQIESSEKLSKATLDLQGELGRGRLQLDRDVAAESWKNSDAKLKLDQKIAENTRKYQQGQLDLGQLNAENDKAYKDATIEHQKRVQDFNEKQLPDSVRSAAAIGGWDPATKAPPTTKQILDGLSRMKEADEMEVLEKLVRDQLVDEDLKKTAQERLTAIINARASRSSSTGGSGFKYSGSTPKAP